MRILSLNPIFSTYNTKCFGGGEYSSQQKVLARGTDYAWFTSKLKTGFFQRSVSPHRSPWSCVADWKWSFPSVMVVMEGAGMGGKVLNRIIWICTQGHIYIYIFKKKNGLTFRSSRKRGIIRQGQNFQTETKQLKCAGLLIESTSTSFPVLLITASPDRGWWVSGKDRQRRQDSACSQVVEGEFSFPPKFRWFADNPLLHSQTATGCLSVLLARW